MESARNPSIVAEKTFRPNVLEGTRSNPCLYILSSTDSGIFSSISGESLPILITMSNQVRDLFGDASCNGISFVVKGIQELLSKLCLSSGFLSYCTFECFCPDDLTLFLNVLTQSLNRSRRQRFPDCWLGLPKTSWRLRFPEAGKKVFPSFRHCPNSLNLAAVSQILA